MKLKTSWIDGVRTGAWTLLLSGVVWGSKVEVEVNSVVPDPGLPNGGISATATATFEADGDDQREQQEEGGVVVYRWLWSFAGDGSVTSTVPRLDPDDPPWTVWRRENTSSAGGSVPTAGYKDACVTVQARVVTDGDWGEWEEEDEDEPEPEVYVGEIVSGSD